MEIFSSPSSNASAISNRFSIKPLYFQSQLSIVFNKSVKPPNLSNLNKIHCFNFSPSNPFSLVFSWIKTHSTSTSATFFSPLLSPAAGGQQHWIVNMEVPRGFNSKSQIIDYYVETLESVLGSREDALMRIYDSSSDVHFGFCCELDEETSKELASLPGVLSVRPDPDISCVNKDYSLANSPIESTTYLFPVGSSKHWLVRMEKPNVGVVTKAQMVDYYVQILTKVLRNERDSQMCIYHVSWQSDFGFCCDLDEECARELAGVPGVLSVRLDDNFDSDNKDYKGVNVSNQSHLPTSSESNQSADVRTKKLFVTGLSFYTSEKTLRAAFEGFGELVDVKIIMDKISKRSKGYAFVEYTTEEAASAALKEMNGKIINGWMIIVDVAKSSPTKYSRDRPGLGNV